jgi:hypothetical protein
MIGSLQTPNMPMILRLRILPLLVMAVVPMCGCKTSSDLREGLPEPVILNAEEYRQEITEVDRLVFAQQPFDDERRALLEMKFKALAQRVKAVSNARFLEAESNEIKTLAEGSRHMPESGLRTELPRQWMRIRNNLFEDQSWFARSAADLEQAPTPQ